MYHTIDEGEASILVPNESKISKDLPVFYNPVMQFNRDVTLALLSSVNDSEMIFCDPMAGSGIRSIRMIKELDSSKIQSVYINDASSEAVSVIKKNLKENKIVYREAHAHDLLTHRRSDKGVRVLQEDANHLFLSSAGFDYIDIDPFGSPNPFLNNSVIRLSRGGILAVTATDTSALCGTYANACKRKYWATPKRGPLMYEIGLRILIRKVQLIGAQFDRALIPIYSYSRDHYMRVFFRCKKQKGSVDSVLKLHGELHGAGPVWLGPLWDAPLAKKIAKALPCSTTEQIAKEATVDSPCYVSVSSLSSEHKLGQIPKLETLLEGLRKTSKAERSHFAKDAIRTTAAEKDIVKLLKKKK